MHNRKRYEYHFETLQVIFDHQTNRQLLSVNLNALGLQGWNIIKIVPRENDFFDLFFQRDFIVPVLNNPYSPENSTNDEKES